jgi:hypothetical protein
VSSQSEQRLADTLRGERLPGAPETLRTFLTRLPAQADSGPPERRTRFAWLAPALVVAVGAALLFASATSRPTAPAWTATGSMIDARGWGHTATLLTDGRVVLTGGLRPGRIGIGDNGGQASAELYDPRTRAWTATADMLKPRVQHTATRLRDGSVLVVSGDDSPPAAELYDPRTGSWADTRPMHDQRRYRHTATLLPNGEVLVAGGCCGDRGLGLASAELYDPQRGTWTSTGSMIEGRADHTATLLPDGKVLVAGGSYLASAELYDPVSGTWAMTGKMTVGRSEHTATLLQDGRVLVVGGIIAGSPGATATAEVYDPRTGTWTITGSMLEPRAGHTATLLRDGMVFVAGGNSQSSALASAELYNPTKGTWTVTSNMIDARWGHTATLLADGSVLVAGGMGDRVLASAELYDPRSGI